MSADLTSAQLPMSLYDDSQSEYPGHFLADDALLYVSLGQPLY